MRSVTGAWLRMILVLAACAAPTPLGAQPCAAPASGPRGSLGASADLIRATLDDAKFGATGQLVLWFGSSLCPAQALREWRLLTTLGADYRSKETSSGSTAITRSYRADAAVGRMLSGGFFIDGGIHLFHNNSLGVELQQIYRVGAGVAVGDLEIGAGPAYVDQDFGDAGPTRSFGAVAFHETLGVTIPFPVAATSATQALRVLLPTSEGDAKQVTLSAQLVVPIAGSLGLNWSMWLDYFENAPAGSEQTYVQTAFGFSWEF